MTHSSPQVHTQQQCTGLTVKHMREVSLEILGKARPKGMKS